MFKSIQIMMVVGIAMAVMVVGMNIETIYTDGFMSLVTADFGATGEVVARGELKATDASLIELSAPPSVTHGMWIAVLLIALLVIVLGSFVVSGQADKGRVRYDDDDGRYEWDDFGG
ncbi:MAG TPA: hypothetical protein VLL52_16100 [Anaerolineae bacterium]|nr:hypothetical protein [Anaerolineae bacterium]